MEFVKKYNKLAAMLITAAALTVSYILSVLLAAAGLGNSTNVIALVTSVISLIVVGFLFYKYIAKMDKPPLLRLSIAASAAALASWLVGMFFSYVFHIGIGSLAAVLATYIAVLILLKRTLLEPVPAAVFPKAGAKTGAAAGNAKTADAAKGDSKSSTVIVFIIIIVLAIALNMCGGGGSSSGRKWDDLTETEKNNARWAYEVKQAINN